MPIAVVCLGRLPAASSVVFGWCVFELVANGATNGDEVAVQSLGWLRLQNGTGMCKIDGQQLYYNTSRSLTIKGILDM